MDNLLSLIDSSHVGLGTLLGRMAAATFLGFLIGLDREYLNRPAGLRTHMLVSLAAATFTLVMFELMGTFDADSDVNADPIRVIEAVTAGVAFLAAGTIIQARQQVHGLTTGAGLWLAGAVGTACGVGAFATAIAATAFGIVVLILLRLVTHPNAGQEEQDRRDSS
jgi:putative Mg2+ transporter-C (MgtC) family protein